MKEPPLLAFANETDRQEKGTIENKNRREKNVKYCCWITLHFFMNRDFKYTDLFGLNFSPTFALTFM